MKAPLRIKPDKKSRRRALSRVPDSKNLKLLLVEDDLEDEQLVCEALLEIEENRQWCNWRTSSITPTDRLADALDCLSRDSFDAILLNLSLPDSPVLLDSFLEVSASAGDVPILVLADEADENLANRLLRQGAQDVLVKSELECAPFAKAIRHAVERQRRVIAMQASAFADDLTGVLTRQAFVNAAAYCQQLARTTRTGLLLASIEITADRDGREPLLIQAAEVLRSAFEPPCIIGRWDRFRFCILTAGLPETALEAMLHQAASNMLAPQVQFTITPLRHASSLEQVLSGNLHLQPKTVILAD